MSAVLLEEAPRAAGKYLTFILGGNAYGVPILKVREIVRLLEITPIPRMPEYVRGVVNLRGKIVPVIDLRMKFGLPNTTTTNRTCIVVVHVRLAGTDKLMGLIVDALEEVDQIGAEDIESSPDFGAGVCTGYIQNMAKVKGKVKALLNIDQIVHQDQALLAPQAPAEKPSLRAA